MLTNGFRRRHCESQGALHKLPRVRAGPGRRHRYILYIYTSVDDDADADGANRLHTYPGADELALYMRLAGVRAREGENFRKKSLPKELWLLCGHARRLFTYCCCCCGGKRNEAEEENVSAMGERRSGRAPFFPLFGKGCRVFAFRWVGVEHSAGECVERLVCALVLDILMYLLGISK